MPAPAAASARRRRSSSSELGACRGVGSSLLWKGLALSRAPLVVRSAPPIFLTELSRLSMLGIVVRAAHYAPAAPP